MNRNTTLSMLFGILILSLGSAPCPAVAADKVKVKSASGDLVAKFSRKDGRVRVRDGRGEVVLQGKPRKGGRKYKDGLGRPLFKVKDTPGGFKLKAVRGGLLWKVRRKDRRIEIANNEEGFQAEVLRHKAADRWVLERDGETYGKVKRYPDGRIKVKDAGGRVLYRLRGVSLSPAWGVLLIQGLPREEAYALMAEMWLRGW